VTTFLKNFLFRGKILIFAVGKRMQSTQAAHKKSKRMIDRGYLEITNICNLNCIFCPKNERKKGKLTEEAFEQLTDKLRGEVRFLYFHLMGEPMLHPLLPKFVARAKEKGFVPVLTTNGTLLTTPVAKQLLSSLPYKIQISLHSQEGNEGLGMRDEGLGMRDEGLGMRDEGLEMRDEGLEMRDEGLARYVDEVMQFALAAAERGTVVVLRLWNQGGYDSENETLKRFLEKYVPQPWIERYDGYKLTDKIYLEYDKMFEWPEEEHEALSVESFCYALRNQIGVLVDGSVVPCCLDHEGCMTLGNLFEQSLKEIVESPRAKALYEGFSRHEAVEPLCQRCGYAAVTKRFRK